MKLWWLAATFAASPSSWSSTMHLLKALDEKGIRYPPTATRRELEVLWEDFNSQPSATGQKALNDNGRYRDEQTSASAYHIDSEDTLKRLHRRKRRQRRNHRRFDAAPTIPLMPASVIPPSLKTTASNLLDQGYRKVRRVKRDLVDAWMEAEDGVRTVPYEYVQRYEDTVWNATPRQTKKTTRHTQQQKHRRNSSSQPDTGSSDHNRRSPNSRPTRTAQARRRRSNNNTPLLLLPPADKRTTRPIDPTSGNIHDDTRSSAQPKRPKRRIYSPYESSHPRGDLFDEIGSFFVDAADRPIWGAEESSSKRRKTRHWKDLWEERFDSMLGIQNDEPYRRWTDGTEQEPDTIIPRRRSYPQQPLWGGGSIVSLIFSSREPPCLPLDNVDMLWESSGSVLTILRWSLRRCARYYGNVCRWATVERTIPQPAVVMLVTSILLSVSKRRWVMAGMALVATRAIGEAIRDNTAAGGWDLEDDISDSTDQAEDSITDSND